MSKKQYIKLLNKEIQNLNGVIDQKIFQDYNYRKEAVRHKKLLSEIRKQEVRSSFGILLRSFRPNWL